MCSNYISITGDGQSITIIREFLKLILDDDFDSTFVPDNFQPLYSRICDFYPTDDDSLNTFSFSCESKWTSCIDAIIPTLVPIGLDFYVCSEELSSSIYEEYKYENGQLWERKLSETEMDLIKKDFDDEYLEEYEQEIQTKKNGYITLRTGFRLPQ